MNISAYLPTQTYPNACKICKRHVLTLVNQPHPRSCFCMAPLPRKWAVPAWLPPLNQETWHIGEVSWNGATPESSIETHLNRIFHYRPSILWGTPIYGNPSWKADAMKYSEGFLQMFPSSNWISTFSQEKTALYLLLIKGLIWCVYTILSYILSIILDSDLETVGYIKPMIWMPKPKPFTYIRSLII